MNLLRNEVRAGSDAALANVADLRRYWEDTGDAWVVVEESVFAPPLNASAGQTPPNQFSSTPERRQELARRSGQYMQRYLAAAVVQQLYALFDGYLLGLIRLWLLAHPRHLIRSGRGQRTRQVPLAAVVDAADRAAVIETIVEREVRDVAYLSLGEQFDALRTLVSLGRPTDDERDRLIELKATRDLLTHGDGVVDAGYLAKAGSLARFAGGERMQLPDVYLTASLDLVRDVVSGLADAAVPKAGDVPARG